MTPANTVQSRDAYVELSVAALADANVHNTHAA